MKRKLSSSLREASRRLSEMTSVEASLSKQTAAMYRLLSSKAIRTSVRSEAGWPSKGSFC